MQWLRFMMLELVKSVYRLLAWFTKHRHAFAGWVTKNEPTAMPSLHSLKASKRLDAKKVSNFFVQQELESTFICVHHVCIV